MDLSSDTWQTNRNHSQFLDSKPLLDFKESQKFSRHLFRKKRSIFFPTGIKVCQEKSIEQATANHLKYFKLRGKWAVQGNCCFLRESTFRFMWMLETLRKATPLGILPFPPPTCLPITHQLIVAMNDIGWAEITATEVTITENNRTIKDSCLFGIFALLHLFITLNHEFPAIT